MKLLRFCKLILFVTLFYSCAVQVAPQGGPKDPDPPKLISSEPPNYTLSFSAKEIRLNFDEYVALNEIGNQLIVSPPLKNTPEIRVRKKSIIIQLRDTLRENTTYTMNFGTGITDNNEGNKLENFQFVFSTGPVIDSLTISGKISNALDSKPEKGILAMLYRNTYDSVPYLERPLYFARTNDSGYFHVRNISPGKYKVVALKDSDGNYLYAPGVEAIGFVDTNVAANSAGVDIRIFSEKPRLRLLRAFTEFSGKILFAFNGPADTLIWNWLSDTTALNIYATNFSAAKDTFTVWYRNTTADSISLFFNYPELKDTISLRLFNKPDSGKIKKLLIISLANKFKVSHHYYQPFILISSMPLQGSVFDQIVFLEDTNAVMVNYTFADSMKMIIKADYKWTPGKKYSAFIPPGTFTDIFDNKNDTTKFEFIATGESEYGAATLKFKLVDDGQFIVQLTDNESAIFREFVVKTDTIIEVPYLDPRLYRIKLIHDRNYNGKWDTGNYLGRIQPEEINFYPDVITIRANWDVDVTISLP